MSCFSVGKLIIQANNNNATISAHDKKDQKQFFSIVHNPVLLETFSFVLLKSRMQCKPFHGFKIIGNIYM